MEKTDLLIHRNSASILAQTLSDTPIAVIQGARQVGKSTLIQMMSGSCEIKYLTLDNPSVLEAAKTDPVSFVSQYPSGTLAIDEVQLLPSLLRVIKHEVDSDRRAGRFLLTGSADLLHVSGANESLAGRAETVLLMPFSVGERLGRFDDFVSGIVSSDRNAFLREAETVSREQYAEYVSSGGYPEAVIRDARRRNAYFRNYSARITDHDAMEISGLAHLDKLRTLWTLLSARTAGIVNISEISGSVQIPNTSLHAYLRLLSDLYLIHELPAWGTGLSSRVTGRKKVHLTDTGIACFFNGISAPYLSDVLNGEVFGPLLECFVVCELLKQQVWSGSDYSLYHYRDRDRNEVDIVIELRNGQVFGVEVKASKTVSQKDFRGLKALRDLAKSRFRGGIVLYTGQDVLPYGEDMMTAPISAIWNNF